MITKNKQTKSNFLKAISAIIYTAIIIFSLIIIISSLEIGGYRMFTVRSGSMEPAVKQGSIVFDKKNNEYSVGDIVTYQISGGKDTMTHRIVELIDDRGNAYYRLKGDANPAPDIDLVSESEIIGKVYVTVPLVGYLVSFLRTLPGLLIFIIIPATIIIYEEINNIKKEIIRIKKRNTKTWDNKKAVYSKIKVYKNNIKSWMEKNRAEAIKEEQKNV